MVKKLSSPMMPPSHGQWFSFAVKEAAWDAERRQDVLSKLVGHAVDLIMTDNRKSFKI